MIGLDPTRTRSIKSECFLTQRPPIRVQSLDNAVFLSKYICFIFCISCMDAETMKRLALIKYLYTQGITQSKQLTPLNSVSILSFHDAAELFLDLALAHVGNPTKKKDAFMEYWKPINDGLAPESLTQKRSMEKLNNARVALKHYGRCPSTLDIESLQNIATQFFSENTPIVFGVSFDSISLIDLVREQDVKNKIHDAQKYMNTNDFLKCISEVGVSFRMLIKNHEYREFYGSNISTSLDANIPIRAKTSKNMEMLSDIGTFARDVIDEIETMQERIRILLFGFDYRKYSNFKRLAPHINSTQNELSNDSSIKRNFTIEDCKFCIEFVIDCALKLQEFDFKTPPLNKNSRRTRSGL